MALIFDIESGGITHKYTMFNVVLIDFDKDLNTGRVLFILYFFNTRKYNKKAGKEYWKILWSEFYTLLYCT